MADNEQLEAGVQPGTRDAVELPKGLEAGIGLAVGSFVLGLVSLPLALFVIGGFTGLIGFVLGIIHLSKRLPWRSMAICGMVLSLAGMAAGTGLGIYYGMNIYESFSMMEDWEEGELQEYVGEAAPEMELTNLDGNKIVMSELRGRRVVLDFWATWCPPCKKEIPHFIELSKTISADEVVIIGISNERAEVVRSFAEKAGINYALVATDSELPEPYSLVRSIPTTFFIDANGLIESVLSGYHSLEQLKAKAIGEGASESE